MFKPHTIADNMKKVKALFILAVITLSVALGVARAAGDDDVLLNPTQLMVCMYH